MGIFLLTRHSDTATVWRLADGVLSPCYSTHAPADRGQYCRIQGGPVLTLFAPARTAGSPEIWQSRDEGRSFSIVEYPESPDARLRGALALDDGSLCIIDNVEHRVWLLDSGSPWKPHRLPSDFKVNGVSRDRDGGLHLVGALAVDGGLRNGFIDGNSIAAYAVAAQSKLNFVRLNLSARDAAVFADGGYSTQFDRVDAAASPLFITASSDSPDDNSTLALFAGEQGIATCLLRDQTPVGFWRDGPVNLTMVTDEAMLFRTQEAGFGWQARSIRDALGDALNIQGRDRERITLDAAHAANRALLAVVTVWQADMRGAPAVSGLVRSVDEGATFDVLARWPSGGEIAIGLAVTIEASGAGT